MITALFGLTPSVSNAAPNSESQELRHYQLNIPRGSLTTTLKTFAAQTSLQLARFSETTSDVLQLGPLSGSYTAAQAMQSLLAGSGLSYRFVNDHTIAIVRETALETEQLSDSPYKSSDTAQVTDAMAPATANSNNAATSAVGGAAVNAAQADAATSHRGWLARLASLFALCSALPAGQACAQSTANTGDVKLEEITVTAEKIPEDVQRTPLAIVVVPGSVLQDRGVNNVQNLQQIVPGIQVQPQGNGTNFYIRGIGSDFTAESVSLTVAFGIDGIFLARTGNTTNLLYDVDRVEVLKGPQGSLFGTNASSGSINIITNRPTQTFGASGAIEVGNHNEVKTEGVINLPISATLAARASFSTAKHSGYLDTAPGFDLNDEDDQAGRVRLLWKPTENVSWLTGVEYYQGSGVAFDRPICGGQGTAGCPANGYGFGGYGDAYTYSLSATATPKTVHQNLGITSDFEWDLQFATLTYLAGYRQDLQHNLSLNEAVVSPTDLTPAGATYFQTIQNEWQDSHELRLSNQTTHWKWVVGAYYMKEYSYFYVPGIDCAPPGSTTPCSISFGGPVEQEHKAGFGQATYSVTSQLRLTAGARYSDDTVSQQVVTNLNGALIPNDGAAEFKYWTGRVGAEYDVAPQSMAYVSAAKGLKPGGYNSSATDPPYLPEIVRDYELGIKNRFLNNRLQVNADVFYNQYTDIQTSYSPAPGLSQTLNASAAVSKGLEFDSNFLVTEADKVDLAVNYLDAKYTDFSLYPQFTGNSLAHSPKWIGNLGYQHVFGLRNDGHLTPRIDVHYESSQNMSFQGFAVTKQPAFTRADFALTYASADDRWSVEGFVRNLTNKIYLTDAQARGFTDPAETTAAFSDPRTFGIRISTRL